MAATSVSLRLAADDGSTLCVRRGIVVRAVGGVDSNPGLSAIRERSLCHMDICSSDVVRKKEEKEGSSSRK